jgi:DNA repair exonuclease SbcCD ATPase subunit
MIGDFDMCLEKYEKRLTALKAKKDSIQSSLESLVSDYEVQIKRQNDCLKAQNILQTIAEKTQSLVQVRITSLINSALNSIHPNPPKFIMNFTTKNNVPNCELLFEENGKTYKPLEGGGYGVANIVSFALRIAIWSLKKTRNFMVLDEPFHFLSPDLHIKAGEMLKNLSEKTGIQFLIISHSDTVNEYADKVFSAVKKKDKTIIKEI